MRNHVQSGETLSLPAPSPILSGDGVLIGSIFGIAHGNASTGVNVDLETRGVFVLPKANGAITLGARLYWDNVAKNVTTAASGNTLIGAAVEPAAALALTATVRLNGSF